MADYFPAIILIGGTLAGGRVTDLFEGAIEDGVTTLDDGPIGDEAEFRALIDGSGPLGLLNADAPYGKLPALEAVCRELGLTFRRESDARYEFEAEIVSWAPGMKQPRRTAGSQDGTAMIPVETIRKLLDAPATSTTDTVARIRATLAGHEPVEVPPLVLVGALERHT